MKISIQKFITPRIPLAVLLMVSCLALWALSYISTNTVLPLQKNNPYFFTINKFFADNLLLTGSLILIITFLNAFLLVQLNTKFSLIRTRTFLPVLIYLVLIATWSLAGITVVNHFTLTLIIIALFIFMNMYRDKQGVEQAFAGSLILATGSLFSCELILLLPAFWIGFIMFQSMSLRTFLASLFGAITPWILYISVRFYLQPDVDILTELLSNFKTTFRFTTPSINLIIYASSLVILIFVGLVGFFNNLHSDSIQTRQSLKLFVILFFISIIITIVLSTNLTVLLPLIAMCYAMIISHPLSLKKNNFNSIIFIIFVVINIFYVLINYFISIQ